MTAVWDIESSLLTIGQRAISPSRHQSQVQIPIALSLGQLQGAGVEAEVHFVQVVPSSSLQNAVEATEVARRLHRTPLPSQSRREMEQWAQEVGRPWEELAEV